MKSHKHVQREVTRHGKIVFYYRQGVSPRIRMQGSPGEELFEEQYELLRPDSSKLRSVREAQKLNQLMPIILKRLKNARSRDKKKQRETTVTEAGIERTLLKQNFKCAVTRIPFSPQMTSNRINPYSPSLDRIDNSEGYTENNVRLVCAAINLMRMDWEEEVFKTVLEGYMKYNSIPCTQRRKGINRKKRYISKPKKGNGGPGGSGCLS